MTEVTGLRTVEMMKRSIFPFILMFVLFAVMSVYPAGALCEDYQYTVTVYAGNNGSFSGASSYSFRASYGEKAEIDLEKAGFSVTGDRYYVKGLRETGHDDEDLLVSGMTPYSFTVTRDISFIVSYAVKGEMVGYTINFVAQDGTAVHPPVSYQGIAGDKVIANFLYVEGYEPPEEMPEMILSGNEAENVFSFVYKPLPVPAAPSSGGGAGGSAEESSAETSQVPAGTGEQSSQEPAPREGSQEGDQNGPQNGSQTGETEPQEITEPEVPLAKPGMSRAAKAGIGAASALAVVLSGVFFILKKRREN